MKNKPDKMSNSNLSKSSSFKEGRQSTKPAVSMDLQERTLRVSNYGRKVTESILRELFSQGGPVVKVVFREQFSFIEFEDAESVSYSLALFDGVELFGDRLHLTPKINLPKTYDYLNTLKQYEQMFVNNPLQWWSRFGDSSKPCPNHICSYSPNAYNYPRTNFDLYNNPMNNSMMYDQMNNSSMPTSSNHLANNFDQRQFVRMNHTNESRREREFDDRMGRSYSQLNRSDLNDYNNNDKFRNSRKTERSRFGHLKRAGNYNSNQPNKKRKHQSF